MAILNIWVQFINLARKYCWGTCIHIRIRIHCNFAANFVTLKLRWFSSHRTLGISIEKQHNMWYYLLLRSQVTGFSHRAIAFPARPPHVNTLTVPLPDSWAVQLLSEKELSRYKNDSEESASQYGIWEELSRYAPIHPLRCGETAKKVSKDFPIQRK